MPIPAGFVLDGSDNSQESPQVVDVLPPGFTVDSHPTKPKGLLSTVGDTFKGAGARMAQGVNESLGSIDRAFGMDEGAKMYQENADYWKQKAEEAGSDGLAAKIYTGIGEAPAGVAEFMGNVPFAVAKGAAEGYREDGLTGAVSKGAIEGVKRLGVGKVFHGIENTGISGMPKAAAMGGTMGAQTAAEQYGATGTINPEDVAASTATGAFLSLDGGGKAAEVKRNLLNEGVQSDIAQDLSSRTPMTLATARERLRKIKVEIPDTGITDNSVSVDDAIHAANSELDKPTGGESVSANFLGPAMIKAVEQRRGAPLKGELTQEELRAQDVSAAMDRPVLSRDALEEVEANKTDPVLAAAMADGRTRQFDLGESGQLETPYRPDFALKKEGVIEPEVIPPEAAKPVPETEQLALPAPEEVKQLPYRDEAAKVPETKGIADAQIPPVAGLSEPVDTQVSPAKVEEAAKAPAIAADAATADHEPNRPTNSLAGPPASWVIRDNATGYPMLETFDKSLANNINRDKYEMVPILQHLQETNARIKEGNPPKAPSETASILAPSPKVEAPSPVGENVEPAQFSVAKDDSEATITPKVLSKVTDVLVKALPDKVDIRIVPHIDYTGPGMDEAFAQHGVKSGKVEGLHQAVLTNGELRSIITLAMDGATERTGYHEIMHAAESLRLIKSKDLAILERAYPTKDGVDASERRADAFADYVSKKEQPANSLIRAMFDRIISFANRLKSVFNGEGWRTADDVFNDLMGGKLKGNAEAAKPIGPQFSVSREPEDKPDLTPISEQFRIVRETADKLNKFADRSKFIKSDVKPTINTAIEGANVAVDGIRRAVNPMARSDAAEAAGRILIEGMGKMAHDVDKFKGELNKALDQYNEQTGLMAKAKDLLTNSTGIIADKVFAALPEKERYDFMQRMDSGEEQATPELQAVADTVKKMFDEKVEAVQNLGTGALDNARDSYFPHIWERGEDAARQIMAGLSRRPLEGAKSFTKQRVFDDVQAGINAGYKMVSSNPLDIVFLKMAEMDKYINAHSALQAMEDSGLVQLIPAGEKPPADFSDISGRYGVVTKREAVDTSTGEVNMKSYRYVARDDVAQIFNNYLSQSLYNNKYVGGIYKAYMGAANNLNMFQLGVFSAFHAGFTSHEAVISHASIGMKALSRGDFKTAAKYLGEAPAAWVTNPRLGDKIIKAWMGGDSPKEMPQIVQWLELAGARRAMDTRFRTNATQKMMEKWGEGNKLGAAVKTIPAIVEQSARPIMEWLVPRQKFGVFGEMANDWVQRHPNATHEELRENMQKIWNRVDSRLGQVVYDRMFLHNVSKNVAQALIRAPGWTGGTILEVGGGTKDLAKYAKDIAFGKKAEMSDRAAYTVSMLAVTGMMNAVLTAAFTGEKPQDWKDLVAFRTGNIDEQGNPERFMLPTYMKDVYAYASDIQSGEPLRTIGHKTHPLLSLMGDIKKNRDYYGVEIRHEGDNPVHQGAQLAGYVAKAFVPFWVKGLQKERERGGSTLAQTAPFIGVMPAPSDMNKSKAEKLAQKLMVERMPNNAKTKEDFERNQTMKKLTNALRKGEGDANDKIRQAVHDGVITVKQAHNIRNNAKLDPLEVAFKRLGYEEAQKVMEVANDEEKERLQTIFKKKERNYKLSHPRNKTED